MGNIGFKEILIIVFIIVILFGAKRIPEVARGMGRGVKEFKDGMRGDVHEDAKGPDSPDKKTQP